MREEAVFDFRMAAKAKTKDNLTSVKRREISILYHDRTVGFEKKRPTFWFVWDYSAGWLLAFWIFLKSMWKIWKSVPFSEAVKIWRNLRNRKKHISKQRRQMGDMKTAFFNRSSPLLQHLCQNIANAAALDDIYNSNASFYWFDNKQIIPLSAKTDAIAHFYFNCPNAQAVRNRYRGVGEQFREAIIELLSRKNKIRVLSIACGSAQTLFHQITLMAVEGVDISKVELTLTDISSESLALARARAVESGLASKVKFVQAPFRHLSKKLDGEYDIIEACGIVDYLSDLYVATLFRQVHFLLNGGGYFITSNMNRTHAARILTWTYNWEIVYRSPDELADILWRNNFQKIKVFIEPWHIHPYAVARKSFNIY
ncbi:MAG: class I SAM-dependent methyltransferase [Elusimicrobia bacterium]|nr:class I SAM-dependent methyltransferase [Elusimicrobiota bacterium]